MILLSQHCKIHKMSQGIKYRLHWNQVISKIISDGFVFLHDYENTIF